MWRPCVSQQLVSPSGHAAAVAGGSILLLLFGFFVVKLSLAPEAKAIMFCRIAEQCKRRVMLTGTPLQNDLEELQNLLRFLMPKLFTAEEAEEIANVEVGLLLPNCTSSTFRLQWTCRLWEI